MRRVALGLAAVMAGVSTWAYADIPDADTGAIHGCVDNKTGVLRIIDPSAGATCGSTKERPITLNEKSVAQAREFSIVPPTPNDGGTHPSLTVLPMRVGNGVVPVPVRFPVFVWQPNSIVRWDKAVRWTPDDPGADAPERSYAGSEGRIVTIEAVFDGTKPWPGVLNLSGSHPLRRFGR